MAETIVHCSCGAKLKIDHRHAGKEMMCPKCKGSFQFQLSVAVAIASQPSPPSLLPDKEVLRNRIVQSGVYSDPNGIRVQFNEPITCIAVGPAEGFALFGLMNNVGILDLQSGSIRKRFRGHAHPVRAIAVSPDGEWAASGDESGTVFFWRIVDHYLQGSWQASTRSIEALAFSPQGDYQGQYLAVGDSIGRIGFWESSGKKYDLERVRWEGPVNCLRFSPDGRTLVAGGEEHQLYAWDISTGNRLQWQRQFTGDIQSIDTVIDNQNVRLAGFCKDRPNNDRYRFYSSNFCSKSFNAYSLVRDEDPYMIHRAVIVPGKAWALTSGKFRKRDFFNELYPKGVVTYSDLLARGGTAGGLIGAAATVAAMEIQKRRIEHRLNHGDFSEPPFRLRVLNLDNGKCVQELTKRSKCSDWLAASTDGFLAFAGSEEGVVKVWLLPEREHLEWQKF